MRLPRTRPPNISGIADRGSKVLFPTSLVGSSPQPEWLIDRAKLASRFPPRTRTSELWRIPEELLAEALDDASAIAIAEQQDAGLDIITDGEIRRESYTNRFATSLYGIDPITSGIAFDRSGHPNPVPRIIGPIRRRTSVELDSLRFLKGRLTKPGLLTKMTLPGPFTMTQQAQNDYYASDAEVAMDYAAAVKEEIGELFAAGVDVVQIDEPYLEARPDAARDYGIEAINMALAGAAGTTALHICFGYAAIIHERPAGYSFLPELKACACNQISIEAAQSNLDLQVLTELEGKQIILGVLDLANQEVETAETVARRIIRATKYVDPERIIIAPDCGLKYLPRKVADGKMRAMVAGAALARTEHSSKSPRPGAGLAPGSPAWAHTT